MISLNSLLVGRGHACPPVLFLSGRDAMCNSSKQIMQKTSHLIPTWNNDRPVWLPFFLNLFAWIVTLC